MKTFRVSVKKYLVNHINKILILLIIAFGIFSCNSDGNFDPFLSDSGTGVRGLDTPDEILTNPYIEDILNEVSNRGLDITPEHGIDPPVISGEYELSGIRYIPSQGALAPGTWQWANQTSDNHIDTNYDQSFQTGSNMEGEIIRGIGNRFTVYSVLEITTYGYTSKGIVLVDGEQDSQGNIEATYVSVPVDDNGYIEPSAGYLELTLNGSAKIPAANRTGISLIEHVMKNK